MSIKTLGINFDFGIVLENGFSNAFKTIEKKSRFAAKSLKKITFQKGLFTQITKLQKEFKNLNATAKKLGISTLFSTSEVGKVMKYFAMAGFKANETIKAMPGLLNLANASQTNLAMTSHISSNILSSFGLKAKDMSKVSDILAKTFTTANIDLSKLGETMKYVGPVAKKAGLSLEETSAMAGLLGNVGIKGSQAGTTLRKMLLSLSSPSSIASKTLQNLGVQTVDASGNMKNMVQILGDVAKATENMTANKQLSVYKNIFGEKAAAGVSKLVSKQGSIGITKYLDVIKNYKGTASKIAKEQNNTIAGSFKALNIALEGISISVTSLFLPALKTATSLITSLTQGLNSFIQNHKTAASVIGKFGGALIAFSVSAFALRDAFNFIKDGYLSLKSGIRSIIFWTNAENRALAINQSSMVLSGIKAKALAFCQGLIATKTKIATLWTNRYSIAQKAGAVASGIFAFSLKGIQTALNLVKIGVRSLMGATGIGLLLVGATLIYEYWKPIKGFFKNLFGGISNLFSGVFNKIKASFISVISYLTKPFTLFFDFIANKFKWISNKVSGIGNIAKGIASFFGFSSDEKSHKQTAVKPALNYITPKSIETKIPLQTQKDSYKQANMNQTNHIHVTINNPSSNVDVSKGITDAMDRNLNDYKF